MKVRGATIFPANGPQSLKYGLEGYGNEGYEQQWAIVNTHSWPTVPNYERSSVFWALVSILWATIDKPYFKKWNVLKS